MPRFKYQGRNYKGKTSGVITNASKREAILALREKGIRVIKIEEIPQNLLTKEITIGKPVKLQHFVIYLRQFATLLNAGISIVDSTKILAEQTDSKALKRALKDIETELLAGNPLSDAASKHKKIFSSMFINMVKAGEAGGNLDETLNRLADYYEKQHRTRQKVMSALAYPIVVGIVAIFVVLFLLVAVVPTFVSMFADFDAKLPAITLFVLNSSHFMQSFWWIVVLFLFLLYGFYLFLKSNKATKYYLDYAMLKIPIFGKMIQKAAIARMTRTLSSLFTSTVPILQALAIVETVMDNEVMEKVMKQSRDSLEKGDSLTDPMKKHWAFPPMLTQMIAIGEETGALDEMLVKVADFYEAEVEASTDRIKSLIEPIMILFLAGIVGTIVSAILIPMFNIFSQIQQ